LAKKAQRERRKEGSSKPVGRPKKSETGSKDEVSDTGFGARYSEPSEVNPPTRKTPTRHESPKKLSSSQDAKEEVSVGEAFLKSDYPAEGLKRAAEQHKSEDKRQKFQRIEIGDFAIDSDSW
jgi:hypothetical protein